VLDVLRGVYVVGAVVLVAIGVSTPAIVAAGAVAVLFARAVRLPRGLDLAVIAMAFCVCWGEAVLYPAIPWYDVVAHIWVPTLIAPTLYLALVRLGAAPHPAGPKRPSQLAGMFLITLSLGLAVGAVWEFLEWSSDRWLGSELSLGNEDTNTDLMAVFLGSALGAAGIVAWARRLNG
jgi:hypothetical protein